MPHEVTRLLAAIDAGNDRAADELLPLVYRELRRLAAHRLANEKPGQTLQPTALVHEAYLRLVGTDDGDAWESRGHFFAAAAESMRRILVESARRKRRLRHGGDRARVELQEADLAVESVADGLDLIALDEALDLFAREEPRKAELVKLRYFAGLSEQETAEAMGISRATAARWWAFSRAWLFERMSGQEAHSPAGRHETSESPADLQNP